MEYRYKTKGVCSSQIILDIEGDTVKSAMFIGGCNGYLLYTSSEPTRPY